MTDYRAEAQRGRETAELLDKLAPYFASLEAQYIALWRAPECKTTALREEAWQRVRALEDLRDHLRTVIDGGKIAEESLKRT